MACGHGLAGTYPADSGNGGHALYRIDLPNDEEAVALLQRCLDALALVWDGDGVTIDTSVFNARDSGNCTGPKLARGMISPNGRTGIHTS